MSNSRQTLLKTYFYSCAGDRKTVLSLHRQSVIPAVGLIMDLISR